MSGTEYNKNADLGFSFFIDENHENKPALFMWGIDCMDASCGFNLSDLNTFINFLEGQREKLIASENMKRQYPLFKEGFEMPTAKDENNG